MKLSASEKLILIMLGDIQKELKIQGEIDPEFLKEAITDGHSWALRWKYPGIFEGDDVDDAVALEVCDIFNMWSAIEFGFDRLSSSDKARVESEAAPWGKSPRFGGFDGNHEGAHRGAARFLTDKLDRYDEFKGRSGLNSHSRMLDGYRRMVTKYKAVAGLAKPFGVDEIIEVLKAQSLK